MPTPPLAAPPRRARLAAGLLALLAAPAAAQDAAAPAPLPLDASTRDYDQLHLSLEVKPDFERASLDGTCEIRFASLVDRLEILRLHCEDTVVHGVRDAAGKDLRWRHAAGVLEVTLPAPLARGKEGAVTVRYRSRPTAGIFFHRPTAAHPSVPLSFYTQGQADDNRRWFPCYDLPDDRATVETALVVPSALTTVGNGTRVESRDLGGGLRRDAWRIEQRIPSYLVTLVAGPYETQTAKAGAVPLEYLGPPGRAAEVREAFATTPAALEFLASYTAAPYPYARYAQVTVWDFVYGGMENASATTMNMRVLHDAAARPNYSPDGLLVHEAAHQWFGDLVTCRTWDHLWLNEGFATYFTDLFFEHRDGAEEFALRRRQQNRGYMNGSPRPERLGLKPSPRGDLPLEMHGGKQYDRGAAVLHQLRLEIGDDAFREGVRLWCRRHADAAVTSEDLRRAMEDACGRDLEWFFRQWVYGAGYPVLRVRRERGDRGRRGGDGGEAEGEGGPRLVVEQTQEEGGGQPAAFRITLPVRLGTGEVRTFAIRGRRQEFALPPGDGAPAGASRPADWIRAGVGGGLLARIEVEQPREAWEACLALDPEATARLDALDALERWPADALPAVAAALAKDGCWAVRRAAAEWLGRRPESAAALAPLLSAAAGDADARVRETAADALGGRTRDEVAGPLRAAATGDTSPYARAAAARALGRVHAPGAFETLRDLLAVESHRETVRHGALDGLAALGDRRALALARPLLSYEHPRGDHHQLRGAALRLLLAIDPDGEGTADALLELLRDPWYRTRREACEAAGNFGVRAAGPLLRDLEAGDPFPAVRAAAKAALAALAGSR